MMQLHGGLAAGRVGATASSINPAVPRHVQQQSAVPRAASTHQQQQQQQRHRRSVCVPAAWAQASHCSCSSGSGAAPLHRWRCAASSKKAAAGGGSSGSSKGQQRPADDMADVIMIEDADSDDNDDDADDDDDDEGVEWVEGGEGDEGEFDDDDDAGGSDAGDLLQEMLEQEEELGPSVSTGSVDWGESALKAAQAVLTQPGNTSLALYLFRVLPASRSIDIRLDKLDDVYGSPSLDDIERFSRAMGQALEAELGAEVAGTISFEVSSPGAERTLLLPDDLLRFKDLPLRVDYVTEEGSKASLVMQLVSLQDSNGTPTDGSDSSSSSSGSSSSGGRTSSWQLADVRANQAVKGRSISKRQRAARYDIPLERLERVRIYVDF